MAPNHFYFSLCIFMISTVLFPSYSISEKPSASEFIKHLQGCHKGQKVKDIHKLKKYLEHFGYLNYNYNHTHANDDVFDDLLESAIKTYQNNYQLNATGTLDAPTVANMVMPRCGFPDIINGTNWMRGGKTRPTPNHGHGPFHTVAHYSFFQGSPRWPAGKTHLTFGFPPNTDQGVVGAVNRAFRSWASATHFTFSQAQDFGSADLKVSFHRGDHGDGSPFDGPGGTVAHSFAPEDGRCHFDADETWEVGAVSGAFDLKTVALHEIGHLLGLGHSVVQDAIMFASISTGRTKGLHADDIAGIKELYGDVSSKIGFYLSLECN